MSAATWWIVRDENTGRYLVLVIAERVAASDALSLVAIGEKWGPARERLEAIGFKCAMESL